MTMEENSTTPKFGSRSNRHKTASRDAGLLRPRKKGVKAGNAEVKLTVKGESRDSNVALDRSDFQQADHVKSEVANINILKDVTWDSPFLLGPFVCISLAMLLVAAPETLPAKRRRPLISTNKLIAGRFTMKELLRDLEHCCHEGERAFSVVGHEMRNIQKATSWIQIGIRNIIDVTEDSMDVKIGMITGSTLIKDSLGICIESASKIRQKFEDWHRAAENLKDAALSGRIISRKDKVVAQNEPLRHAADKRDYQRKLEANAFGDAYHIDEIRKLVSTVRNNFFDMDDDIADIRAEHEAYFEKMMRDFDLYETGDIDFESISSTLKNFPRDIGKMKEMFDPFVDVFVTMLQYLDYVMMEEPINPITNRLSWNHSTGHVRQNEVRKMALHLRIYLGTIEKIVRSCDKRSYFVRYMFYQLDTLFCIDESEKRARRGDFVRHCRWAIKGTEDEAWKTTLKLREALRLDTPQHQGEQSDRITELKITLQTGTSHGESSSYGESSNALKHKLLTTSSSYETSPQVSEDSKGCKMNLADPPERGPSDVEISFSESSEHHSAESTYSEDEDAVNEICTGLDENHIGETNFMSPILNPARQAMADRVMEAFWVIFDQRWPSSVRQHTGHSQPVFETGESRMATQTSTQRGPTQKRQKKNNEEDPNEDKDDRHQPPACEQISGDEVTEQPKFACPYRKHDPVAYSIHSHRVCALSPWPNISRVKEHLYRRHRIPIHCGRCWLRFGSEQALKDHSTVPALEICQVVPGQPPDGLTPQMELKLRSKKRAHRDQTDKGRWEDMYRMLFPLDDVPTPYYEFVQDEALFTPESRELIDYEVYARRELPRLVRASVLEVFGRETQPVEASIIASLVDTIQACQARLFESYSQRLSNSVPIFPTVPPVAEATASGSSSSQVHVDAGGHSIMPSNFLSAAFQPPPYLEETRLETTFAAPDLQYGQQNDRAMDHSWRSSENGVFSEENEGSSRSSNCQWPDICQGLSSSEGQVSCNNCCPTKGTVEGDKGFGWEDWTADPTWSKYFSG